MDIPRLIARDDLVGCLDRAASGRVTIISAPAGSGKTSLLRAWADHPGQPHRLAVVQVQRDQHGAQQFWLALLSAVRQSFGTASEEEPRTATPDFNGRAMVDRVLSELTEHHGRLMLVIDDLHELASPDALAQLTRLLTNLPGDVHAVLATRRDLRLRLHQLRLAGELAEIRAADLRLASARRAAWVPRASPCPTRPAWRCCTSERKDGLQGLRLAAISLADHPDPERFVAEFSGSERTVAEYLIAEMLERQPADIQCLLLRTSLFNRVNGDLADLLTGRPGAERILLDLEDANTFVVSLDPERTWFRYHHLFGDLLRLELRRRLPDQVPTLHRWAAGWFIRQGQVVDAIRHTQAAGDWPGAAELLADHSFSLTMDGQAQTIQALLRAFPPGADHPELALVRAGSNLVQGRLDKGAASSRWPRHTPRRRHPIARQRRLRVAIASLKLLLSLARRRGVTWLAFWSRSNSSAPRSPGSQTKTSRWTATCERWR